MAKGLTPIIGLAVVVALALIAVFGAMSLTNPAFAAVGTPADAELAERGIQPQQTFHDVDVYIGEPEEVDLTSYIGDDNLADVPDDGVTVSGFDNSVAGFMVINERKTVGVTITAVTTGAPAVAGAQSTGKVDIVVGTGDAAETTTVYVTATLRNGTPATVSGKTLGTQYVEVGVGSNPGEEKRVKVSDLFVRGRGSAGAITYAVRSSDVAVVMADEEEDSDNDQTGYIELNAAANAVKDAFATIAVTAMDTVTGVDNPTVSFLVFIVEEGGDPGGPGDPELPFFNADSRDPGKNTRYTLKFNINDEVNTLIHDLVIELPDYGVPSAISTSAVTITTGPYIIPANPGASPPILARDDVYYTFTPEDVSVDGEEIFISIGDITEDDDEGIYIVGGTHKPTIEVVFRQAAGISNPTEAKTYFAKTIAFGQENADGDQIVDWEFNEDTKKPVNLQEVIPHKISLDEGDGGLGTVVTATGKGFKDKTTLTVFLDKKIIVMWDHDGDDATEMRRLSSSRASLAAYCRGY